MITMVTTNSLTSFPVANLVNYNESQPIPTWSSSNSGVLPIKKYVETMEIHPH
jgi:hypothetical protein